MRVGKKSLFVAFLVYSEPHSQNRCLAA